MSNIFLSTALIFLASEEVGCLEIDSDGNEVIVDDCQERVFGVFRPTALITNIAVISGVLSALFMPVAGAIIDYSPHRWMTGVVSAALITTIQIVQIGTGSNTWFSMAILQAITGCFYQVQVLATYSYLPDLDRKVGNHETMTHYVSNFTMNQFAAQAVFLLVVIMLSQGVGMDDVETSRFSQGLNAISITLSFTLGWRLLPKVGARHVLEDGKILLLEGFRQNWITSKRINRDYKKSLRWFLLGIAFGEPAANAFTVVAVVFLNERLKMSGSEIGIFFFVVLVAMVPGGGICRFVSNKTNPNVTIRLSMFLLFIVAAVGVLIMTPENAFPVTYIWGVVVGLLLGCFYPAQLLFFGCVVPEGQEAEITGFYVYCTQILVWLPPLVFSLMVEADVDQRYGIIAVAAFFLLSIAAFSMAAPFDELVEEVKSNDQRAKLKSSTSVHELLASGNNNGTSLDVKNSTSMSSSEAAAR